MMKIISVSTSIFNDLLASKTTSAAGGNKTDLATSRRIATHRRGSTNMLVITTTVGMLYGVHGNTTDLGPAVALGLVLVVRGTGTEKRLVNATTTGDDTNDGTAVRLENLLRARGE